MSYFLNTGRIPDWRYLCIHVFGAPCNYAPPIDGPVHKRAALTEGGYFVGIQHLMALVIRKKDMKLISVSTKKIKGHGLAYIAPLESKTTAEFEHAEVAKDSGEASTSIEAEMPETEVLVDSNASVKKP